MLHLDVKEPITASDFREHFTQLSGITVEGKQPDEADLAAAIDEIVVDVNDFILNQSLTRREAINIAMSGVLLLKVYSQEHANQWASQWTNPEEALQTGNESDPEFKRGRRINDIRISVANRIGTIPNQITPNDANLKLQLENTGEVIETLKALQLDSHTALQVQDRLLTLLSNTRDTQVLSALTPILELLYHIIEPKLHRMVEENQEPASSRAQKIIDKFKPE